MHNNNSIDILVYMYIILLLIAKTITAIINNELLLLLLPWRNTFIFTCCRCRQIINRPLCPILKHYYIGNNKITFKDGRMWLYEFLFYKYSSDVCSARNNAAKYSNQTACLV